MKGISVSLIQNKLVNTNSTKFGFSSESKLLEEQVCILGGLKVTGKESLFCWGEGGRGEAPGRTGGQNNFPTQSPTWGRGGTLNQGLEGFCKIFGYNTSSERVFEGEHSFKGQLL